MPPYYQSDILTSVPLWPIEPDPATSWVGAASASEAALASNLSITIPLISSDAKRLASQTTVHIVHNLFGYDIELRLSATGHSQTFTAKTTPADETAHERLNSRFLPESLSVNRFFRVACPYSTVATAAIEPQCQRPIGNFMELSDSYETIELPERLPSNTTEVTVVFSRLAVVVTNYVEDPQMYIAIWRRSESGSLLIGGSILTIAGIVTSVVTICIFFAYSGGG
jgi:hypothetical protein